MANPFARSRWYHKLSNIFAAPLYRLGPVPRGFVLLTVTGRKTGKARHRPIRAIREGAAFYAVAILGERSDWLRNVRQNPQVKVKYGRQTAPARARPVTDAAEREKAQQAYDTVVPYDYLDYPMVEWAFPTRRAIREGHRRWAQRGAFVAIEIAGGEAPG